MRSIKLVFIYTLLCLVPVLTCAQQSGFDILTIGPGSEALGLNESVTAVLLGASDIYSNPANLAFEPSSSFSADYSLWVAGLRNSHVAANFKRKNSAIALGVLSSEADDFESRNRPGPSQGSFSVSYLSIAGAYAYAYRNFSTGVTGQFLQEQFLINNASGFAFNAGISSRWLNDKLTLSTVIRNVGELSELNQQATTLPSQWRAGFEAQVYTFNEDNDTQNFPIRLSLSADFVYPLNETRNSSSSTLTARPYAAIAARVEVAKTLVVYSGYRSENSVRPISFGTTVKLNNVGINYALIPFSTGFGNVHSIGLSYRF